MTIRAQRVLNLDRRYYPGEEIDPSVIGARIRRLRDAGYIRTDGEELNMANQTPDEEHDPRIDPRYHELEPAAQEDVLRQQAAAGTPPDLNPSPQAGADVLAQATPPDPDDDPVATDVASAEPTGGASDPSGQNDPDAARRAEEDEARERTEASTEAQDLNQGRRGRRRSQE